MKSSTSERTASSPGDDYPDFVIPLARAVSAGQVERGIAVCGSGVGASVCANKIPGVHAGLIGDHFSAHQGVEDDHMNIICMGGRTYRTNGGVGRLVETYLASQFSQAERHLRRLAKVASPGRGDEVTPVAETPSSTDLNQLAASTPSAPFRWMRCNRPSPDTPARPWRWRRWFTRSGIA